MKLNILALLIALTSVLGLSACNAQDKGASGTATTAPAEKPALYLDVRTQQEYDAGHVAGATLIPYDELETRWTEVQQYKDQPVVVYCRSGRRSGIALEVLKEKGFTKAVNGGGLRDLEAQGVPTE